MCYWLLVIDNQYGAIIMCLSIYMHLLIKPHNSLRIVIRPGTVAHAYNPSTLGGHGGWIMRSRDGDHPGQQGATPSLLKIQKLAGHGGACL